MVMRHKRLLVISGAAAVVLLAAGAALYVRQVSAPGHTTSGVPVGTVPVNFDRTRYSTTDPTSLWVIINKQHPIDPQNFTPPDLVPIGNNQEMRAEAADALLHMFADAKAVGYTLTADSGYRSYSDQVAAYGSLVKAYGQTYAETVSAHPGYSEHQTGWAVDIGSDNCNITNCFGDLPAGKWTQENAWKYGFILRYTQADSSITGYSAEAWHFRYVGTDLSTEMHKQNIPTLEQFFNVSGGATYKPVS
jgi:D-alanyl-D-alanine carboxypeptidase